MTPVSGQEKLSKSWPRSQKVEGSHCPSHAPRELFLGGSGSGRPETELCLGVPLGCGQAPALQASWGSFHKPGASRPWQCAGLTLALRRWQVPRLPLCCPATERDESTRPPGSSWPVTLSGSSTWLFQSDILVPSCVSPATFPEWLRPR